VKRGVMLDRDGTLIEEVGYLDRLDRIRLFSYSVDAVRLLNRAGYAVVVVTNQAGVARGYFDEPFVEETHRAIAGMLSEAGAMIDAFYYCPHLADADVDAYRVRCDCRKPQPGMIRKAAADLDLDLSRSFIVGDRIQDLEAGRAVGSRGILVRTGYGYRHETAARERGGFVADHLMQAVSWILRHS
jgi:D-glycero-D-manno-heptose 1,7-bisphosphate phosphatase